MGKRILLVDDQPEVRTSIKMLLNVDRHTVIEAATGEEALALFESIPFDLVITDYAMPGMLGDQLAAAIKQKAPSKPVILISGQAAVTLANTKPVDVLLYKPFKWQELRGSIAQLLRAAGP